MRRRVIKKKEENQIYREEMPISLGKPPKASSEAVSKSMKSNVSKDTGPEITLRKALLSEGIRGYRINWKKIPGRPDICFPRLKLAIFVNGCFWHRCPKCRLPVPKKNQDFWQRKFIRNKKRDRLKKNRLERMGWKVIVVWECEIKKELIKTVDKIKKYYKKANTRYARINKYNEWQGNSGLSFRLRVSDYIRNFKA